MTRSELIDTISASYPQYNRDMVEKAVLIIFDEISSALADDRPVSIRGFGTFFVKHRKASQGRNPRTGETVSVDKRYVPAFRFGKKIHRLLNEAE